LREIAADNASEQQQIIFDPIPRVDGIEASADPLFEPHAPIGLGPVPALSRHSSADLELHTLTLSRLRYP
jgi:hypothetical protein